MLSLVTPHLQLNSILELKIDRLRSLGLDGLLLSPQDAAVGTDARRMAVLDRCHLFSRRDTADGNWCSRRVHCADLHCTEQMATIFSKGGSAKQQSSENSRCSRPVFRLNCARVREEDPRGDR